eukprot:3078868-Pyramimonas_sp.AAC.1
MQGVACRRGRSRGTLCASRFEVRGSGCVRRLSAAVRRRGVLRRLRLADSVPGVLGSSREGQKTEL